ncbi:MAG: hypothetical protein JWR10_579 [Rubritepida sp.]|nr:hypothetical protein [Rubritepida sp.]
MLMLPTRTWLLAGIVGLSAMSLLMLRSFPSAPPVVEIAPLAAQPEPLVVRTGQVVAIRDIPRGTSIETAALGISAIENPPAGAFVRMDDVTNRVALDRIRRGDVLTADKISPGLDTGGLSPLVPMLHRAVTLRVAEDTGVAFLIRPGDHVDVALATRNDPEGRESNRSLPPDISRMLLQDLLVLAVGDALSAEPPTAATARTGPPLRNVTLAATPEQLLLLGLARGDGGYLLALRNPLDREVSDTAQLTRARLLDSEAPPMPPPSVAVPAERAPRPIRSGPDILRGPSGASR